MALRNRLRVVSADHPVRLWSMMILLVTIVTLGVIGYTFRDRLNSVPAFSHWFTRAELAHTATDHDSTRRVKTPSEPIDPENGEPRGEINLDPRRQQLIGVRTALVERGSIAQTVRAVGIVRYDETRLAEINMKIEGWIRDLYVDFTGEPVKVGQPLFTIYSPDLVNTQHEYLLALRTREQLRGSQVADAREYADRLVESARIRLALWDFPPEEVNALETTRQPRTAVVFRSPVTGYVIEKQALQGMHVMPGQTLYKVADLSTVWVEADIYEQDIPYVQVGRSATVTLDAYPGLRLPGRTIYLYPFVEEKTRTGRVRLAFPNQLGRLKPGMYANVELQAPVGTGLTVPTDAVLDSGREQIVFVAVGDGYFEPRPVSVGRRMTDRVEIIQGLKAGEQVAVGATFFLDSESQLRAGLRNYESIPPIAAPAASAEKLDIAFRSQPDPPKTGENTFEVTVKDETGKPITDGEVSLTLFMPAMPTMNMPAMRNDTKLSSAGGGLYRGSGQVMIAGRWDVTVTVSRGGQRLGSQQFALNAH